MSSEFGECWITRIDNPGREPSLRIDRADPVIRISPQLLAEVPRPPSDYPATFDGKVLRINGVNQTVVYRVRDVLEPVPGAFGHWDYIGEWPD